MPRGGDVIQAGQMKIFLFLIVGGALIAMCRRTLDGLLWTGVLLLLLVIIIGLFPETGLTVALRSLLPFSPPL
jgi:hypothetical protein